MAHGPIGATALASAACANAIAMLLAAVHWPARSLALLRLWALDGARGDMPGWLYVAMAGGVLFSLLVGRALMALVLFQPAGYDDRAAGRDSILGLELADRRSDNSRIQTARRARRCRRPAPR